MIFIVVIIHKGEIHLWIGFSTVTVFTSLPVVFKPAPNILDILLG